MPPKKENEQPSDQTGLSTEEVIELEEAKKDENKRNPKSEAKEEIVIKSPRHSIDQDRHYATEAVSKHAAHALDDDAMAPLDSNRVRFKEHLLHDHEAASTTTMTTTPHHLEADDTYETATKTASKHDLTTDRTADEAATVTPRKLGDQTKE